MYLWDLKAKKKTFSSYKWEGGIRTKVFHMKIKSQELLTPKKKKKKKRLHIACSKKNQIKIYLSLAQFTQLGLIIEGPKYSQHDLSLFLSLSLSLSLSHTHTNVGPT